MKFLFGIWTMTVALAVSSVAAYYSIVGLTAIFAAAVIPVIIMGTVLEIAKITTAIWLHSFWDVAPRLIKWYLTSATVILMLITSMGIFGFLSKAHIEQNANSGNMVAQIEQVDQEIARSQQVVARANIAIEGVSDRVSNADTDIQARIDTQQRLIADITARLERDIATQQQLVSQYSPDLQMELTRISALRMTLTDAIQANDVRTLQRIVGASIDGVMGRNTTNAVTTYTTNLDTQQTEITVALAQQANDPRADATRAEINRLQQSANVEIGRAQDAINAFRTQLINVTTADNTDSIVEQELIIDAANDEVSELLTRKFELQSELRLLKVEVGPVAYIAELVYGESNPDLLEEAVRWVILVLVVVFDPLALVLVIAGLSILHRPTKIDNLSEPDSIPVDTDEEPEPDSIPVDTNEEPEPDSIPVDTNEEPEPDSIPVETDKELDSQITMPETLLTTGIKINRTLHDS
jgi:lysozyme family protein